MATAKRMAQDSKVEGTVTKTHYEAYAVLHKNGVETARHKTAEQVEVDDTRRIVPQPDRIVLDLSIEEALTLSIIGGLVGGYPEGRRGDMDAINAALRSVNIPYVCGHQDLSPGSQGIRFRTFRTPLVSTPLGTGVSSGAVSGRNVGSLLRPAVDLSAKCGTSTTGSGAYDLKAAQVAQQKAIIEMEMRRRASRW